MIIKDEQQMLAWAAQFAHACEPPLVIYLYGQLGAGKTTFSRGFLAGLGFIGRVKSPTYTLVEPYSLDHSEVFHFDLYRIHDPEELELIGIRDYCQPSSLCLIEWPEQGQGSLPPADLSLHFQIIDAGRRIEYSTHSQSGDKVLEKFLGKK